jgi:predicted glycosyltransferase
VLVYGRPHLVDHQAEYGLSRTPTYCGWVVEATGPARPGRNLLVVAAGGGGDGADVFDLAVRLMGELGELRAVFAPGPYADVEAVRRAGHAVSGRARIADHAVACGQWFSQADAVLCMAGYNSTMEALAAGQRPILVPRRSPRREQAIRASRLAALGLADVVDEGADASEIAWLLQRPRALPEGALAGAGIDLDGAENAAARLALLVPAGSRR